MRPIWMLISAAAAGPASMAVCEAVCAAGFLSCIGIGTFVPGLWVICGITSADCFTGCVPALILPTP